MTLRMRIALALVACLAGSTAARADGAAESKRLSSAAAVDFKAGNLAAAEEKWEAAFKAAPDPSLLFALGRCYAADGKPEKSAAAFRDFLDRSPKSSKRADVQRMIKEQEAKIAERAAATAEPPAAPAPPPSAPPPTTRVVPVEPMADAPVEEVGPRFGAGLLRKWWFWAAVGGVVVVGTAVGLGVGLTRRGSTFPEVGPGISNALVQF